MGNDTVKLLKECNSGCKMAISSIEQVQKYVYDNEMKGMLDAYKEEHEKLKSESERMLKGCGETGENPGMMASAFSWVSTEVKMNVNGGNSQVARIMMDGCNMGIQSIAKYINEYTDASQEAQKLARELVRAEEEFSKKMEKFL